MIICTECGKECGDDLEFCDCCGHRLADAGGVISDREELEEKLAGLANDPRAEEENPGAMCYAPMP